MKGRTKWCSNGPSLWPRARHIEWCWVLQYGVSSTEPQTRCCPLGSTGLLDLGLYVVRQKSYSFFLWTPNGTHIWWVKITWESFNCWFDALSFYALWPRSRGSTKRTSTNPMGSNVGATALGNIMVGRVVVLLCIAMAKKIWWCLEQPKGPLLEGHLLFQSMLRLLGVQVSRVSTSLCWFGADTQKPLWIWSRSLAQNRISKCFTSKLVDCV